MAVRRSQNWVNQQRVDVPHLRSIESAVRSDFDELLTSLILGDDKSYVLRGFEISMVGAVGSSSASLQMIVDGASVFHGNSVEAGTYFVVPTGTSDETLSSTTNERVDGAFTPSALNYVGLEYTRQIDNATTAQVFLWNPTNKTEITKTIPLAATFDYKIVITSSIWAANVLPLAIVETDGSNNVLEVEDRRPMLFRLGTAGTSSPNPFHTYPWNNHAEGRTENPSSSTTAVSPFRGGDKMILTQKEWMDAIMTAILEIKGTPYWYSFNTGGSIIKLRGDLAHLQMNGSGAFTHDATVSGQLNWSTDIYLDFIGSRLRYKFDSNVATTDITLADDQVAYVNLVRGVNITPNLIFTNGSAIVSSVGAVSWTTDVTVGDYIKIGAELDTKYYEILTVDSVSQVTLTETFAETSTGSSGAPAQYAYGHYETNAAPSTNRHIQIDDRKDVPFNEDMYWLAFRKDNGGATPRIYLRNGAELEKSESAQISDNINENILITLGLASETASFDYGSATVAAGSLDLPNYNTVEGESARDRMAKLTAMLADVRQDLNIELDPGSIAWDGANIAITGAQLSIPGTTVGAAPITITDLPSTALPANSCYYVDINRTAAGALALTQTTLALLTPSQQRLVIARNVGGNILTR